MKDKSAANLCDNNHSNDRSLHCSWYRKLSQRCQLWHGASACHGRMITRLGPRPQRRSGKTRQRTLLLQRTGEKLHEPYHEMHWQPGPQHRSLELPASRPPLYQAENLGMVGGLEKKSEVRQHFCCNITECGTLSLHRFVRISTRAGTVAANRSPPNCWNRSLKSVVTSTSQNCWRCRCAHGRDERRRNWQSHGFLRQKSGIPLVHRLRQTT